MNEALKTQSQTLILKIKSTKIGHAHKEAMPQKKKKGFHVNKIAWLGLFKGVAQLKCRIQDNNFSIQEKI